MKTLSDISRTDLERRYIDLALRLQDAEDTIEYYRIRVAKLVHQDATDAATEANNG